MSADTIQAFLAARGSSVLETRLVELKSSGQMRELFQLLQVRLAGFAGLTTDLGKALWDLLDLRISDIFVKTWNEAGILKKYLDPEEYQPNAEVSVTLSGHKITSEHHPYLDIVLDGMRLARIILDVNLEFDLDGLVLKIKNGRIREIRTGSCKAKGKVSYKGLLLLQEQSESLDLPGSLHFEKGIPIAP
jgi:hypothetical protein